MSTAADASAIRSSAPASESLAHFAAIVESSDDAIISKDLEGRILSWNPAAQRIFGYSAAEAIGRSIIALIVPPDRLEEERSILDALRRGDSINQLETVRRTKDGRAVDVSITVFPVRDANGTIIGAAKIARDNTARMDAERALQRAHQELAARTGELARFNHAAVGREMRNIELKREVNSLRERLGEAPSYRLDDDEERLPSAACAAQGEALVPLEAILKTDELHKRQSRPADYESENRAMTDLVQALADAPRTILQVLVDKVLELLRAGSAGLSLLTRDGERFYWAAIAGQWSPHLGGGTPSGFGPCGDVLDCNQPMLFTHWEHRYPYLAEATPLAEEGLLVPFHVGGRMVGTIWAISHDAERRFDAEDLRLLESLGRVASAAYQAVEVLGELDQRRAALSLLEDAVHARRQAEDSNLNLLQSEEALLEADRRKNEFLAMLAHELRNPLAPIATASELLARTVTGDAQGRIAVEMIKRQLTQLTRLVDDLLDVSRITQGRIQLRKTPVDVAAVIAQAIETVEPQLRERHHELTLTASSYELHVLGDPARLVQCVSNILANAIKYTEPGGHIKVRTRGDEASAHIEISDSGTGIPAELLPHVFDLFVQSERTLDRAQGGLGIGLAVVKRLVEMHEGSVDVRSDGLGQGSVFEIRLPRIARPEASGSEAAADRVHPRRILIVDDNADAADSISMLLAFQGHQTRVAYSATEALASVDDFEPQVGLLDIGLPDLDGYELARQLRAKMQGHALRLVALTGYGQAEDHQRVIAAGFDAHLVKPVRLPALERALEGGPSPAGNPESESEWA